MSMPSPVRASFPRLYAIADRDCFLAAPDMVDAMVAFVGELLVGGVNLIQYRNKSDQPREMLSHVRELRRLCPASPSVRLIMNDRVDLCLAGDLDGVHVGQEDLSPPAVRAILGSASWVGVSTHDPAQVSEADRWPVDYVAIGPVFPTASRANPSPVIGLEGVRAARRLTNKPLVAIGGINRTNCRAIMDAGADSVAVIADLLAEPRKAAEEFLRILG